MVTASPQLQLRLMDLQALDTRLQQLIHAKRTHPTLARLTALERQERQQAIALADARAVASDIGRELTRADDAAQQAHTRAARNQSRLDSGTLGHKDAVALTEEMTALRRHIAGLEEAQLGVMERAETQQLLVDQLASSHESLVALQAQTTAERDAALAQIDDEGRVVLAERDTVAKEIAPELLNLYESLRKRLGGLGAARLHAGCCEGCGMHLPPRELEAAALAPDDEVLRCEECGRILVRAVA